MAHRLAARLIVAFRTLNGLVLGGGRVHCQALPLTKLLQVGKDLVIA